MMDYLKAFRTIPGIEIDEAGRKAVIPLLAKGEGSQGRLISFFPVPGFVLHCIDIRSTKIQDFVHHRKSEDTILKINYCSRGRCELELCNGGYTYLTGGEIAVDIGYARESFYYPAADYEGIEILIVINAWEGEVCFGGKTVEAPKSLAEKCAGREEPQIFPADELTARIAQEIRGYATMGMDSRIIAVKALEFLMVLDSRAARDEEVKRSYCTLSQVEIAKEVRGLITNDLSVRLTAKELAARFGISETSLKNYFRGVYGCGYAEYQNELRMKEAARLLEAGSGKVVDIAHAVGYVSQTKFGAVFKTFFGVTPLEYRRSAKIRKARTEK